MNERINGLWWKARIGYNNQNCDPEVLEKFAELIVRECVQVSLKNSHRDDDMGAIIARQIETTFRS